MISRKLPDGWVALYDDDGREVFRYEPPVGGLSFDDVERIVEHIKKAIREREHGPS